MTLIRLSKKLGLGFATLFLGIIGYMDWKHFFPVSAHSDLKFQLAGECLEVLTTVGVICLAFVFGEKRRREGLYSNRDDWFDVCFSGAAFGVLQLALSWRDFFPNDRFDLKAGLGVLVGAFFMGIVFGLMSQWSIPKSGKPSKKEERSVV